MNVVIGLFHESGHQKFHMNDKIGAKRSPILYIQKDFSIGIQKDELKKKNVVKLEDVLILIYMKMI